MIGLLLGVLVGQVTAGGERQIDFQKDVAPILQQQCVDCHGPALQMATGFATIALTNSLP